MTDSYGRTTGQRGKYVTDCTRWMAVPATGVEINQSNGQYTFTEEAEGEYELFCETYQSAAHPEATAKSASVKVTVNNEASFDVKQLTAKSFSVTFDKATKVTLNDVTMNRLFKTAADTYKYPQVVKDLKLAEDGKSATVELFSAMADGVEYELKLTGFDPITFKASVGAPASMTLSMSADKADPFVQANAENQTIKARLFDANGVEVTEQCSDATIIMSPKEYSQDGSYYVAGDIIWFNAPELQCTVVAEYMSGKFDDNGNAVGNVTAEFTFISQAAPAAAVFSGVSDATLYTAANYTEPFKAKTLELPMGDEYFLAIKVKDSAGKESVVTYDGQTVEGLGKFTFEEVTPNVAALNKNSMTEVIPYAEGQATFVVNLQKDENSAVVPVGAVTITVKPARALTTVTLDKNALSLPADGGRYSGEYLAITAKDQYGKDVEITKVEVYPTNPNVKVFKGTSVPSDIWDVSRPNKLYIQGPWFALPEGQQAAQFSLTAKVNDAKEVTFTVLVKKPFEDEKRNIVKVEIERGSLNGDVACTSSSPDEKSVKITGFVYSNGVKYNQVSLDTALYSPELEKTCDKEDYYCFKVMVNGKMITTQNGNVHQCDSGAIEILFSTTTTWNGVSKVVYYEGGNATYTVTLMKSVKAGDNKYTFIPVGTVSGTTTCNKGSYTFVKKASDSIESVSSPWKYLEVKNTKGETLTEEMFTTRKVIPEIERTTATDYIFVKSVTFYEEIMPNVYVPYEVKVNQSFKNDERTVW